MSITVDGAPHATPFNEKGEKAESGQYGVVSALKAPRVKIHTGKYSLL